MRLAELDLLLEDREGLVQPARSPQADAIAGRDAPQLLRPRLHDAVQGAEGTLVQRSRALGVSGQHHLLRVPEGRQGGQQVAGAEGERGQVLELDEQVEGPGGELLGSSRTALRDARRRRQLVEGLPGLMLGRPVGGEGRVVVGVERPRMEATQEGLHALQDLLSAPGQERVGVPRMPRELVRAELAAQGPGLVPRLPGELDGLLEFGLELVHAALAARRCVHGTELRLRDRQLGSAPGEAHRLEPMAVRVLLVREASLQLAAGLRPALRRAVEAPRPGREECLLDPDVGTCTGMLLWKQGQCALAQALDRRKGLPVGKRSLAHEERELGENAGAYEGVARCIGWDERAHLVEQPLHLGLPSDRVRAQGGEGLVEEGIRTLRPLLLAGQSLAEAPIVLRSNGSPDPQHQRSAHGERSGPVALERHADEHPPRCTHDWASLREVLEVSDQLDRGCISPPRVSLEAAGHDRAQVALEPSRRVRAREANAARGQGLDRSAEAFEGGRLEGAMEGHGLLQQDPGGPHVRGCSRTSDGSLVALELGGQVGGGPQGVSVQPAARLVERLREPEVAEVAEACAIEHEVPWLHVAVDDLAVVEHGERTQGREDRQQDLARLVSLLAVACCHDVVCQGSAAADELAAHREHALQVEQLMGPDQVRQVEVASLVELVAQEGHPLVRSPEDRVQDLERPARASSVLDLPNAPGGPGAQQAHEAVGAQRPSLAEPGTLDRRLRHLHQLAELGLQPRPENGGSLVDDATRLREGVDALLLEALQPGRDQGFDGLVQIDHGRGLRAGFVRRGHRGPMAAPRHGQMENERGSGSGTAGPPPRRVRQTPPKALGAEQAPLIASAAPGRCGDGWGARSPAGPRGVQGPRGGAAGGPAPAGAGSSGPGPPWSEAPP